MAEKTLVIMRGLPGAGKSTWIRTNYPNAVKGAVGVPTRGRPGVVSADHWFEGADGVYRFDPTQLGAAHGTCMSLATFHINHGNPVVIVDNTNTQEWEWEKYAALGTQNGYEIRFGDIYDGGLTDEELARRNTHGVPVEAIRKMRTRWAKTPEVAS